MLDNYVSDAVVTSVNATADGFGLENLANGRPGVPVVFATSESDHEVRFDFGAALATGIDRGLIAEGHNFAGIAVELRSSVTGFGSTTLRDSVTPTADEPIEFDNGSAITDRYWLIRPVGTGAWRIPEFHFGPVVTPASGLDPEWEDVPDPQLDETKFPASIVAIRLGPDLKMFIFETANLDGADLATYSGLVDASHSKRVVVFYHPDDSEAPRFVQVETRSIRRRQRSADPQSMGVRYQVGARLRQVRSS